MDLSRLLRLSRKSKLLSCFYLTFQLYFRAKNREIEEREHMIFYLKYRVPFFSDTSKDLISTLCDKFHTIVFNQGESLMDQGDEGDCMFVIYSGECGVYIFDAQNQANSHKAVAIVGANTVVGESAVMDKFGDPRRKATVLAHSEVVCLSLTKDDYHKTLY